MLQSATDWVEGEGGGGGEGRALVVPDNPLPLGQSAMADVHGNNKGKIILTCTFTHATEAYTCKTVSKKGRKSRIVGTGAG